LHDSSANSCGAQTGGLFLSPISQQAMYYARAFWRRLLTGDS
jgi:hypothetical protein